MGGDLPGIVQKLDYLQDLGVNAIYLNPIFLASSNHRYNTYDYYQIDHRFGSAADFQQLLAALHRRRMRIILDGVFNHCGRGFYPFHDLVENQQASPYQDWFFVRNFPLNPYGEHQYATWHTSRNLPQFNLANREVREYLLGVARYWTRQGIDGWRLDAAADVSDPSFWQDFRTVVKQENPQAYLVGEVWADAATWLQGDRFDGTTNYELRSAIVDFLIRGVLPATAFAQRLAALIQKYAVAASAMYNLVGSHDTPRILTLAAAYVAKV